MLSVPAAVGAVRVPTVADPAARPAPFPTWTSLAELLPAWTPGGAEAPDAPTRPPSKDQVRDELLAQQAVAPTVSDSVRADLAVTQAGTKQMEDRTRRSSAQVHFAAKREAFQSALADAQTRQNPPQAHSTEPSARPAPMPPATTTDAPQTNAVASPERTSSAPTAPDTLKPDAKPAPTQTGSDSPSAAPRSSSVPAPAPPAAPSAPQAAAHMGQPSGAAATTKASPSPTGSSTSAHAVGAVRESAAANSPSPTTRADGPVLSTLDRPTRPAPATGRPAADSAPAQENADAELRTEQLMRALRAQISRKNSSATIRLDPPELGVLRVEVQWRDKVLEVRFETETMLARDLLRKEAEHLQRGMEAAGLRVERIDVQVSERLAKEGGASTPFTGDHGRGGQAADDRPARRGEGLTADAAVPQEAARVEAAGPSAAEPGQNVRVNMIA